MERTMSVEDKIRRAEEIYYKRRKEELPIGEHIERKNNRKTSTKLFKKMIRQILLCLIIYGIFNFIVNSNYIFSEDFSNKVKEILQQDIDFKGIYSVISSKIQEIYTNLNKKEEMQEVKDQQQENVNEQNIGGAEEEIKTQEETNQEEVQVEENNENNLSQMEQDANYIKSTISFIKPIEGTISSEFGLRNPTTATVPKNHTGIDIASEIGRKIISATDGTVILSSNTGDYGKHLKIQINDVILVYAHCNNLYVNEGNSVKQGQEIAEVGATGNATGPHLHFEIRYQDRYVNPQLII